MLNTNNATIVVIIREVVMPEDTYFAAFNAETGEKVAPWADSDTSQGVMDALLTAALLK